MLEGAGPPRTKEEPVQRPWGRAVPAELGNQHRGPSGWNRVRRGECRDVTDLAAPVTLGTHTWLVNLRVRLQACPAWRLPGGKPGIHLGPCYDWRPGQGRRLIWGLERIPTPPPLLLSPGQRPRPPGSGLCLGSFWAPPAMGFPPSLAYSERSITSWVTSACIMGSRTACERTRRL